jgi:hypothetical protein
MKNLFNDISQEEKNRILEMHSGKKTLLEEPMLNQDSTQMSGNQNSVDDFLVMITDYGFKIDPNSSDKPFAYIYTSGKYVAQFKGKPLCFIKTTIKNNQTKTQNIFLRKNGVRVTLINGGEMLGFNIPQDMVKLEKSIIL